MTVANIPIQPGYGIDTTLDPVVEEVRERGRLLTQRFINDPKRLFEQLRQLAQQHPEKMVSQLRVVAE